MSKKKLNRNDFIFDSKNGEVLKKLPGQVNGIDFCIMNLTNCSVYIMDYMAQIFIDDCSDCKIFLGPVEGSVFVRNCHNT